MRVAIAAIGLCAAGALGQVNILENPGFESGVLDPWYQVNDFGGPEDWNVTTTDPHTGKYCATDVGNKLIGQDFAPVPVEDIIEASVWIRQPEVVISGTIFMYSDGTQEQNTVFLSSDAWEFFDLTGELDPGKELVFFGTYGYSGGGNEEDRTFVDDWSVLVEGGCTPDCNGDGSLDILDFVCFQGLFQNGDPAADCNGDGVLNILDFVCFQGLFQQGC